MISSTSTRERRDWALLIFIIPIGIILMLVAGQFATRLVPEWSINAGMQSNLDPNNLPKQQNAPVQPILPAILTPLSWFDTFLTPGAGSGDQLDFPPFVVFEPSATPEFVFVPPTGATQPSPTAPTSTPPTVVVSPPPGTGTSKPPVGEETPTPPPTQPTATPPVPTATGTPSTPPSGFIPVDPPPVAIDVNGSPNGDEASLSPGQYTVIDLGTNPANQIFVSNKPDGKYDLIVYEDVHPSNPSVIHLDHIIIGISKNPDGSYYEIFNWGNNSRDQNSNVDFANLPADTNILCIVDECDNREIPLTSLYADPVSGISTGILIDVDAASGHPPEGQYRYVVIISPLTGILDVAQVDAIVVDEVPGGKVASASASIAAEESIQPAEVAPAPVVVEDPIQPVEDAPAQPTDEAISPPIEEVPAEPPP